MRTFRSVFKFLVPSWLWSEPATEDNATGESRVMFSLAVIKDMFAERAYQGLNARFPSRAPESALALIGDDRGIIRGRSESRERYAARLQGWRYPRGHRVRGSAFALLEQVSIYLGDVLAWTIDRKQNYHERTPSGSQSYEYNHPWNWDAAPETPRWARFWVGIDPTQRPDGQPIEIVAQRDWGDPELYGGDWTGASGQVLGVQGLTEDDVRALRGLVSGKRPWKPAGTRAEWLCIQIDGTFGVPDGTWNRWSKYVAGSQQAARFPGWRFISLCPGRNNVYGGDPTTFPLASTMVDFSTYAGDPSNFPASATLVGGGAYAGNPASFPASVLLPDDGS